MNKIHKMGCLPSPTDIRDYRMSSKVSKADAPLPSKYELPLVPVKNQGGTSSCVAHAVCEAVERCYEDGIGRRRVFSTEFIYGYRPLGYYQGEGMYIREALKTVQHLGDVYDADLPGNHEVEAAKKNVESKLDSLKELAYPHRISSYYRCYTETAIKKAIVSGDPVVISVTCYLGDRTRDGKWISAPDTEAEGGHAMYIYGWCKDGWKVQNSWGTAWCDGGRCIMPYDMKLNEAWGIHDGIIDDEDVKEPYRGKFGQFIAKLINAILNLFRK